MLRTRVKSGTVAGLVLSLVFGCLLSVVQSFDLFVEAWEPHMGAATPVALRVPYSAHLIREGRADGRHGVLRVSYEQARIIVPPGTVLSESDESHRTALAYDAVRRPARAGRIWALAAIDFTLAMMLTAYLRR